MKNKSLLAVNTRYILAIILGGILSGLSIKIFLLPNSIAPAGISGLAVILNRIIPINTGSLILLLNLPLYIFSWSKLGMDFSIKSFIGTVSTGIAIDYIPFAPVISNEPILGCVFGGIMMGAGLGIAFRNTGSTGGTDIIAKLLAKAYPIGSIGNYVMALDVIIIVLNGMLGENSAYVVLYSLICMYIGSYVIDILQNGVKSGKCYNIITTKGDEIARSINCELKRGVTRLPAVGAYTKRDCDMLVCLVLRTESARLQNIVRKHDPGAFVFITDAREINGVGFGQTTD